MRTYMLIDRDSLWGLRMPIRSDKKLKTSRQSLAGWSLALLLGLAALPVQSATVVTNTTAFDYDVNTGVLLKEMVEPADSSLCVVTEYVPDSFGHPTKTTTRNCNGLAGKYPGSVIEAAAPSGSLATAAFDARVNDFTYTTDQRFIQTSASTVSATLSLSESRVSDGRFGGVTSHTGPNGLMTQWVYDGFGRKILERRPDGTGTKWDYAYCTGVAGGALTCPNYNSAVYGAIGKYAVTMTPVTSVDIAAKSVGVANGPYTRVYYNALGNEIRIETQGFDGALINQDTYYDDQGRVRVKSRPYYVGQTSYRTIYTYDLIGRVIEVDAPGDIATNGSVTSTSYSGLTMTVTDPLQHKTTTVKNVGGQIATITDHLSGVLQRVHDPLNNLVQSTDAKGNVITLVYDRKGRKTGLYDPDLGVWSYSYDALGQLVSQKDAKAQVTNLSYDKLGRMIKRSDPTLTSEWYYDAYKDGSVCAFGKGKLCEARAGSSYVRKQVYDSLGRPSTTTTFTASASFTASVSYDSLNGRIDRQTYPSGLSVVNTYTALGYLQSVKDGRTNTALWTAKLMDAEGHVSRYEYGNGVVSEDAYYPGSGRLNTAVAGGSGAVQSLVHTYDLAGRLKSRTDNAVGGLMASYDYDELNRLKTETRTGGGLPSAQVMGWTYDAIGNMVTRTETGRPDTDTYNYNSSGAGSVRPHAVASVSGFVNGMAVPRYEYDANGNLSSGAGRTVSWFGFNKVQSVSSGASTLNYLYDAEQERSQELYYKAGVLQRTTVYLNPGAGAGLYYEDESGLTGTKKKHYLSAGGATFGMIVCTATPCTSTSNTVTQYWHKDHLGSVSVVTDVGGAVVERLAYEPFGKRRISNGLSDANGTLVAVNTDRGYTGHEHMEEVGLINMNGRVYDPGLARLLSADPHVTFPNDGQSYNRYSYVMNQPLGFTDPTGYDSWGSEPSSGESAGNGNNEAAATRYAATIQQNSSSSSSSSQRQQPKDNPQKRNEDTSAACSNGSCSGSDSSKSNFLGVLSETLSSFFGGYDKKAQASWDGGNYVGWGLNTAFATTYGVLNALSFGDAGAAAQGLTFATFGVVKTFKGEAVNIAEGLAARVEAVHGALDPIAATRRTTAALDTAEGTRILAAGGRDLSPAQRVVLAPGEVASKLPGAHAEVTALANAEKNGLTPTEMAVSRKICSVCQAAIEKSGGFLTSLTTAIWPR